MATSGLGIAKETPPIPVDWAEVIQTVALFDLESVKTVCPECRDHARRVVTRAVRLKAYLDRLQARSDNFPDNMAANTKEQRDRLEFVAELQAKLAEMAALKKDIRERTEKLDQASMDASYLFDVQDDRQEDPDDPASGSRVSAASGAAMFLGESLARVVEFAVNGKPANAYLRPGPGETLEQTLRKNRKSLSEYIAISGTGRLLHLFDRAIRLEGEIRQLQSLVADLDRTVILPGEFNDLEELYSDWQEALAEQLLCERKHEKECKKHQTLMPPSETGDDIVERDPLEDVGMRPFPGYEPADQPDPLEDPSANTFAADDAGMVPPGQAVDANTMPAPSAPPIGYTPPRTPAATTGNLPPGVTPEQFEKMKEQVRKLDQSQPDVGPQAFYCPPPKQICARFRGRARTACLDNLVLESWFSACNAYGRAQSCLSGCQLTYERLFAGSVLRAMARAEIRGQIPATLGRINSQILATGAEMLALDTELAEIMRAANTPPTVLYQDRLTDEVAVLTPVKASGNASLTPIGPVHKSPVGPALVRQKELSERYQTLREDYRRLLKEGGALETRIHRMVEAWKLPETEAQCTTGNAEKLVLDCENECRGAPPEDSFHLSEGLIHYSGCITAKIDNRGVAGLYERLIYLTDQ